MLAPHHFVNKTVTEVKEVEFIPKHTFDDFGFMPMILQNLRDKKFTKPTPIQDASIPHIMEGKDVIGLANTGSGKTAAFVLPSIHRLKENKQHSMALIIAPTRELAVQIEAELRDFSRSMHIFSALCVGGMNMYRQKAALSRRPHFVIGTPGRLKDLMQQGALRLDGTSIFVLDEVDRMLDMGFINDIKFIMGKLPQKKQSLCFSATITPAINQLLQTILVEPVTVSVRTSETGDHIEQDIVRTHSKEHKLETLIEMLHKPEFEKVLVFGETKWGVQKLSDTLNKSGLLSEAIHGNKSQPQRQRALKSFKDGRVKILVATDVAARGLDIPNVSHVINFDQPNSYEDYIHRIGRTGRAGKKGMALTFITVR
jgi:superfamily II DNA/RNA helicase